MSQVQHIYRLFLNVSAMTMFLIIFSVEIFDCCIILRFTIVNTLITDCIYSNVSSNASDLCELMYIVLYKFRNWSFFMLPDEDSILSNVFIYSSNNTYHSCICFPHPELLGSNINWPVINLNEIIRRSSDWRDSVPIHLFVISYQTVWDTKT